MTLLEQIQKEMQEAVNSFNARIPAIQKNVLRNLLDELRLLDTKHDSLRASVKNIRLLSRIRSRLQKVILTKDYKKAVTQYIKAFDNITALQNQYFEEQEARFKPPAITKELKKQVINDTVERLTEAGIGTNIGDSIAQVIRQSITTGASYASLTESLRALLTKTGTPGILERYTKQITTDAINQYSAQYMQTISSDLGYEWFRYAGNVRDTTRPFCEAMKAIEFFHISEVPDLLKAKNLFYDDDGVKRKVEINPKTELPQGMIEGTDADNFFVRRGGYNCRHQINPVNVRIVPKPIQDRVFASAAYKRWSIAA